MNWEREITVEGKIFQVTISDDHEALRSAFAEGRAVVGLWDRKRTDQNLAPAAYVVEDLEDIDDVFLERVVRRREGLPWNIAQTPRLTIRELVPQDFADIPDEPEAGKSGALFLKEETLNDYIRHQYVFYEYGIWAVVDHVTGRLVGKAGISNLELTGQEEFLREIKIMIPRWNWDITFFPHTGSRDMGRKPVWPSFPMLLWLFPKESMQGSMNGTLRQ